MANTAAAAQVTMARARSDLTEEIWPQDLDLFLERRRIEIAQRRRNRGEKRVAVLRRVAEADDFLRVWNRQRRDWYDGLREDAPVVAVVAAEGEDGVDRALVRARHARVASQCRLHLVDRRVVF